MGFFFGSGLECKSMGRGGVMVGGYYLCFRAHYPPVNSGHKGDMTPAVSGVPKEG